MTKVHILKNGTNFNGWKKEFKEKGFEMPTIIFWNVACNTMGVPATKYDQDVTMISGFSPVLLDNLLTLENYNPVDIMILTLQKYINVLQEGENS